jgi:hypothetical protein
VGFLATLQSDIGKRYPKAINPATGPQPPGRFSFGTQLQGGPIYTDAFRSRRAPGLVELVENYHALIYAMVARNRNAVARVPMRLLADGSRVQGKPSRACDAIRVSRSVGRRLASSGQVSTAAVDQVYEIRNHPLLDILDEPDPYGTFTREKLIGLLVSYMDVVGDGYLVPEGNGWDWTDPEPRIKGPPENLWAIYPQYTIPLRMAASTVVQWYQYFADRLPQSGVMRFRHNHSLRDAYGGSFSPTYAGEPYRRQEQELVSVLSQVLGIGPRPNLIATAKDAMVGISRDQKEALEQDLIRKHAGGYAGGVLVTTGAFDFKEVNYQQADIASKEIAQHDRDNLASIFDQPPTYYTIDSNLANLEAADVQFNRNAVEPRCKTVAAQFTRLARMCDRRLFFAHDPVMPEDDEVRERVLTMQLTSGRVTINQVNEEDKYPPVKWGDEPWLPSTLQQPSMAQEKHDLELDQGEAAMDSQGMEDGLAVDQHEHQKGMDKAQLKSKEERTLDMAQDVLRSIQAQIGAMTG